MINRSEMMEIVVISLNLNSASSNNRNRSMHLRRYHLFLVLLLVIAIEYIARVHRVFVMRVCQHQVSYGSID